MPAGTLTLPPSITGSDELIASRRDPAGSHKLAIGINSLKDRSRLHRDLLIRPRSGHPSCTSGNSFLAESGEPFVPINGMLDGQEIDRAQIDTLQQELGACAQGSEPPSRSAALKSAFQERFVGDSINEALVAESFQYPEHTLRLFVHCDEPSLSALPWELIELQDDGMNIVHRGALAGHPFGRVCRLASFQEPMILHAVTLRLLVIESNPGDAGYPELAGAPEEVSAVLAEAARASERVEVRHLFQPDRQVLFDELNRFKPHVIHYAGHADSTFRADNNDQSGQLVLCHPTDRSELLCGEEFADVASVNGARLVVLSGCVTGSGTHGLCGALMARGIKSVVSMQAPWPDECGRHFARDFYQALFSGADLCDSIHRARTGLRSFGLAQFLPVLTLNGTSTRPLDWTPGAPFIVPYPASRKFVGREAEFQFLWNTVVAEMENTCVVGLSGTGKTLLASQFCYQARNEYPGGIYWINATDSSSLESSLSEIGDRLGLFGSGRPANLKSTVFQRMQNFERRALIVLDNIEPGTNLDLPQSPRIQYLATRKSRAFPLPVSMIELPLGALTLDESTRYMSRLLNVAASDIRSNVEEICGLIGSVPITLANAAARIRSLGVTVGDYSKRLFRRPLEAAEPPRSGTAGDTDHRGNILGEIEGNVSTLTQLARAVLYAAAHLSSSGIPRTLLRSAFGDSDSEDIDDALEELSERCLIHFESGNRVGIHEMVQHFVRLGSVEASSNQVLLRLTSELALRLRLANERKDWRELWPLLPHCRVLADFSRGVAWGAWHELILQESTARYEMGEARIANDLLSRCANEEKSEVVALSDHIRLELIRCEIQSELEDHEAAVETAETLVATAYSSLEPSSPEWIDIYCRQGYAYKARRKPGDLARALRCYGKAVRVAGRNYEKHHTSTANCYNFIGPLYVSAGMLSTREGNGNQAARRYRSALNYLRQAYEIDLQLYGSDHVSTAMKRNNLGQALRLNGELQAALEQHFRARDVFLRQSEQFQEVPWTDFHIGLCLMDSGSWSTAREYLVRARHRFAEMYGEESGPVRRVDEKLLLLPQK